MDISHQEQLAYKMALSRTTYTPDNAQEIIDLIHSGADVHVKTAQCKDILFLATEYGHLEVVQAIMAQDKDINRTNKANLTPFLLAVKHQHADVAAYLALNGANCGALDSLYKNALSIACENNDVQMIELLSALKLNVNHQDKCGKTPLMLAAKNGHIEVMRALIKENVNLDMRDEDKNTALMHAILNKNEMCALTLIASNADVNVPDCGYTTPLMHSAKLGMCCVAYSLCLHGAVDGYDKYGKNVNDYANESGHKDISDKINTYFSLFEKNQPANLLPEIQHITTDLSKFKRTDYLTQYNKAKGYTNV